MIDKVQEETKNRTDRKPPGVGRGRGRDGRDDIEGGRGQTKGGMRGHGGMDEGGSGRSQGDSYCGNPSGNKVGGRGRG